MQKQGIKFKLSTKVISAKKNADGKVDVVVEPAAGGPQETVNLYKYNLIYSNSWLLILYWWQLEDIHSPKTWVLNQSRWKRIKRDESSLTPHSKQTLTVFLQLVMLLLDQCWLTRLKVCVVSLLQVP